MTYTTRQYLQTASSTVQFLDDEVDIATVVGLTADKQVATTTNGLEATDLVRLLSTDADRYGSSISEIAADNDVSVLFPDGRIVFVASDVLHGDEAGAMLRETAAERLPAVAV